MLSGGIGMVQPFALLEFTLPPWRYGKVFLALLSSVVVAYTNDGYLRDAHEWVSIRIDESGTYGSLVAATQNTLSLEGIRMCTSRRLDRGIKQYSIFFITDRSTVW